jgi:iron complex outermembrane receptor protein
MAMDVRSTTRGAAAPLWTSLLLASTMLTAVAAQAQTTPERVGLEEVVVTAQKRSENLQDVPVSIQALGTETLQQLQVSNFNDYVKYLPSVSFQTTSPGFSNVYMRGVASGGDGNHSGPLPSVGIYLDEQPITTIQGALDVHVYDIARVEALAGPQGTLYGASSQAGTIRIITNKPDPTGFKAGYDLEVNSVAHGGMGHVEEGFVNLPLSDTVAIRLVGWNEQEAGYIDNALGTRTYPTSGVTINNANRAKKDYNDVYTKGARAALRIDLNENWTITPTVMGQVQKSDGLFAYDPQVGDLKVTHFYPESSKDRWVQAAMTIEGQISNLDVVYAGSFLKRDVDTNQDYSDYSFFYDTAFGYGAYWLDNAGNPTNPSQYIQGKDRYTKESHEFRISTPDDKKLRFVGGVFYQRQVHRITQRYKIDNLADDLEVPGFDDTLWLTQQRRIDRDTAAFGELSYDITDKLTATAGVRFFKSHNTLKGFYGFGTGYSSGTGVGACFTGETIPTSPCTNLDKGVKENGHTPKVNLTYKIDPDKLVYLTYSKGFRPGGINRRSTLPPYTSDFLTNYEFGWKTSWFENRLRWNGAVYQEDWKGFQFALLGTNGLTEIKNAGQARVRGVESDVTWAVTHGWTINGSAAYTDAKLTKNYCGFIDASGNPETNCSDPQAPSGTALPITPKFKANLTSRYEFTLGDFDAHLQSSYVYQTGSWTDLRIVERGIIGRQKGYMVSDYSAGLGRNDWTVELFIKNAWDKRASLYRYAECAETVCGGQVYTVPNQPRLIGLKFGQKF